MAILSTARLRLRPIVADDRPHYLAVYTHPDVMRDVAPVREAAAAGHDFERSLARCARAASETRLWTCERLPGHQPVGLVGLETRVGDEAELGILLLPDGQRQGLGTEALSAVIDLAVRHLDRSALVLRHRSGNQGMRALATRLGFTAAGEDACGDCRWHLPAARWRHDHG